MLPHLQLKWQEDKLCFLETQNSNSCCISLGTNAIAITNLLNYYKNDKSHIYAGLIWSSFHIASCFTLDTIFQ